MTKMAALQIHLMCISCTVWMVISSLRAIDAQVPDGLVYTDQHRTARKGDQLVLKCQFYGSPFAVFWKKGEDPFNSPDLIKWVEGESQSGPCVRDQSCSMDDNYSLIINHIGIANQGTHICLVSNYLGILIHNFTEVAVFAPPMEPFPVIEECPLKHPNDTEQTCTLSTSDSVTITCSASSYFPDIDLFFLQGSKQMGTTNFEEVTNLDGTKNKSIFTSAEPSETPYVCVASDIPGSQDQRTVSIEVISLNAIGTTIPSQTTLLPVSGVAKVVAPVVIILLLVVLCVGAFWWRWRNIRLPKSESNYDPEAMPLCTDPKIAGKISFYELWYLVQNMDGTDLLKLKDALSDLGITVAEVLTRNKAYELLCGWKDTNTSDNEGMRFHNTLFGYGLGGPLKRMTERRKEERGVAISEARLDYIVRQISNEKGVSRFLRELITEQQENDLKLTESKDDFANEAMEEMMKWRERTNNGNHFILLSLALERAKCRPLDRTFFKVPDHLVKPISPQEVKRFVYGLTGRHCRRLGKAVGITNEKKIAAIINENNGDLFDTQAMISDWITEQECTHYEKRCTLDDAVIKIGRHDLTDSFGTTDYRFEIGETLETPHRLTNTFNFDSIFDDDLATLLKHLPSNAIPLFLEKLGISVDEEDNIEKKIRDWRDESMAESGNTPLQKLCSIHKDLLLDMNYNKGHDVKDDELENIIESITSAKQMKQLTARLGISNDQGQSHLHRLKDWRDKCPMEKRRKALRKTIDVLGLSGCIVDQLPLGYVYQAEMVRFAYHILYHDVEPLATLLGMDTSKVKTVREPLNGTVGLLIQLLNKSRFLDKTRRNDFSLAVRDVGYLDVARSAYFGYEASLSELYNMTSGLSKDEMQKLVDHLEVEKHALTATKLHDNLNMMKIWKSQLRPEPIHFRLKLALGLRAVGRDERASDILAGRFRTTDICSNVVVNICNSLDGHKMEKLCEHLKLKTRKAQDDQTAATLVVEWVRNWLKKFDKFTIKGFISPDKLIPRGKENDELFRAGFFELAEEIMLLEVSKSISVKPANKEFDRIANEDEGEINQRKTSKYSVETSSEDQAEGQPTYGDCDHDDGAPGAHEPTGRSAKEEDEEAPAMPTEHTQLIANIAHDPSESSV